tara:strand:- start:7109 stop:8536 length:1428 start_codon:yes stop_codon:yes gene_type:complete
MIRNPLRSLRAQLVVLIVLALAVAQAISLWLFVDERSLAIRAALGFEAAGRAANVVRLIEQTPPELQQSILQAADSMLVRFSLDDAPMVTHLDHDDSGRIESYVRSLLDDQSSREIRVELHDVDTEMQQMPSVAGDMSEMHQAMMRTQMRTQMRAVEMNLSIAVPGGRWLNVGTSFARPPLQWPIYSILTFGTTAAAILIVMIWYLVARLTGPLRRLARSAERFGRGEDVAPLPEAGPEEVRNLTRAFNRMQARLTRFVADRTRILAAVSHDLRSPLTALRVRAEMVDDDETREALIETTMEMQQMAEATLDFAKGLSGSEAPEAVRLAALLAGVVAEEGEGVDLAPGPDLTLRLRPVSIRRALRNVISNALRYGDQARVSWHLDNGDVVIEIHDQGPGIPENELERVFDPFYRLETSRSLETGGHGLGLSIARSILRAHGGEIVLANDPQGGLVARVTLPLDSRDEFTNPMASD